jgi:hypothetical protein
VDLQTHGKATLMFANGDKEEYEYVDGKVQGKAVYTFTNGDKGEYEYVDGGRQGNATCTFVNHNANGNGNANGDVTVETCHIHKGTRGDFSVCASQKTEKGHPLILKWKHGGV